VLRVTVILLLVLAGAAPHASTYQYVDSGSIQVVDAGPSLYVWLRSPTVSVLLDATGKPNVELIVIGAAQGPVVVPVERGYDLWRIVLLNGTEISSTLFKLKNYSVEGDTAVLTYENRNFLVRLYFEVSAEGVYTWLELENRARAPIEYVSYMILGGLAGVGETGSDDHVVVPVQMGLEIHNPLESLPDNGYSAPYPSPLSMQFTLLYDESAGLYYGVHDPRSHYKVLKISPRTYDSNLLRIWWEFYPSRLGEVPEYETPRILLAGFAGRDWRCGAEIYKRWAHEQWYVSKGPVSERHGDTWAGDLAVWYVDILPDETQGFDPQQHAMRLAELHGKLFDLTRPTLAGTVVEVWNWNKGGFDNDYPEFLPSRFGDQAMKELIQAYHEMGARTSIYFNARLVDVDTRTYQELYDLLPRNKEGEHYIEVYGGGELVAAVAHPALEAYTRILLDQIRYVVSEYGVDAVFLDQVAVAAPVIDYREGSSIGLRAGDLWYKAYARLIGEIKSMGVLVAVEGVSEVYVPHVDFYWLVQTMDVRFPGNASLVHLFNYVYGDYVVVLNMEPHPESSIDYYRYIAETSVGQGYVPRLTNNLAYAPPEKINIIKSVLGKASTVREHLRGLERASISQCGLVSYSPEYLPVTGLARSKEGTMISRPVWKPTVDYTVFEGGGRTLLFVYSYFPVSVEVEGDVLGVVYNGSRALILEIEQRPPSIAEVAGGSYVIGGRPGETSSPEQAVSAGRPPGGGGFETFALGSIIVASAILYLLQRRAGE